MHPPESHRASQRPLGAGEPRPAQAELRRRAEAEFESRLPAHLAIIMDGNGRWAQGQGLRRVFGHKEGTASVREVTTACAELGLESLTLYAFSVENWKRPPREVSYLMRLLKRFLRAELPTFQRHRVRLKTIGRIGDLPPDVQQVLRETEQATAGHEGLVLRLALSYGSRAEIGDALRAVAEDAKAGRLDPSSIDEETLRRYLYDPHTPDPDMVVRTAGELRLSNFLLWQASYSEIFVSRVCWPDFRRPELLEALREYGRRVRKFGGLVSEAPAAVPIRARAREQSR
jgi:undecaprenyl diphosphate synthase